MKKREQIGFGDWSESKNTLKYLKNVIKSRRLTYGKYSQALEKLFCEKNGVDYAVFCSSGTAALYASLGVLKNKFPERAKDRPYVVLPACTFISDVNVIVANGFEPLFVDIAANYNISYTDLEKILHAHGRKVFAVMPSSLMGRPVDGERIKNIIDTFAEGAFFILDSCENISSKYDGKFPERFADFSCWSTYISHLLISGACGGFIGTNNKNLAIAARSFINHGRDPGYMSIDDDNDVEAHILKDITAKRFSFVQHGLNFRMGEVEAAMCLAMLEDDFEGQLEIRRKNAEYLVRELSQIDGLIVPKWNEKEEMRHMMLPLRVSVGTSEDLVNHLEANSVETRPILPIYQPVTHKYLGTKINFKTNFPMAYETLEKGLYVGCHQYLKPEDLDYIVGVFKAYFKK